jgi:hypothetical protein
MPQFTLLVRVEDPVEGVLLSLLDSMAAQTHTGWELILAVSSKNPNDRLLVDRLIANRPQVRAVVSHPDELVHWVCNRLLPVLGTWVGLLEQDDFLTPDALEKMALTIASNAQAKVFYSNDCHETYWGHTSFERIKGEYDPIRMRSHEYIGSLAFINVQQLRSMGGFDKTCSEMPTQDLYLRMPSEDLFEYVPYTLCRHIRTYREPDPTDPRHRLHMVRYDLQAIKNNLRRGKEAARAVQGNGMATIQYNHNTQPTVTAYVILDDDWEWGIEKIRRVNTLGTQRFSQIKLIHLGTHNEASVQYREMAMAFGNQYNLHDESFAAAMSFHLPLEHNQWMLIVNAMPVSHDWAKALIDHTHLVGVGAVGAKCMFEDRLVFPGVLKPRYAGEHWNTRGRFNHMQVPHRASALGSACLLVSTHDALTLGRLANPNYPTLWAMDLSARLNSIFRNMLYVPTAVVKSNQVPLISEVEAAAWRAEWTGWVDRYELHDPLS